MLQKFGSAKINKVRMSCGEIRNDYSGANVGSGHRGRTGEVEKDATMRLVARVRRARARPLLPISYTELTPRMWPSAATRLYKGSGRTAIIPVVCIIISDGGNSGSRRFASVGREAENLGGPALAT